jgi:hypothetical protein
VLINQYYKTTILLVLLGTYPLIAQTWSTPERLSPYVTGYYVILGQGLTADSSGTPWCGWVAETHDPFAFNIYVRHHTDTAWSDPDTIYPFTTFWSCNLATDANGYIWMVAEEGAGVSACFYNGSSWSNLMAVPIPASCSHYPVAAGDDSGDLRVCWASMGPGDGHHIWGNAYIEGQWGSPVLISYPGSWEEFAYSMITDKQGKVWVGWNGSLYDSYKLYTSINDVGGWSDTMLIAEDSTWTCGPALTVDTTGKVWAGWCTYSLEDSIRDIYASYYDGNTWSAPMLVSSEVSAPFPFAGDWPIAITSDDAAMVWLAWTNPDTNICYSYWDGSDWSIPAPVDTHPAGDSRPKMTFDGERIWVTWIRKIGSNTDGVYASYTYGVGVEEEQTTSPLLLRSGLCQTYPNPCNSNTTILYQLSCDCRVVLRIYSISGELVRTLVSTHQQAGLYAVRWNGKDDQNEQLPGGVYFIQSEIADYKETRKIILLK